MYIVVSIVLHFDWLNRVPNRSRLVETGLIYNRFKSVGLQQPDRFEPVVCGSVQFLENGGAV